MGAHSGSRDQRVRDTCSCSGGHDMNSVEDLDVFKLAHELALKIYSVTKTFPREETYSLIDQMRRAAISVGMNLMEGAMRLGSKEYRQFVGIARGSAGEVCYQLLLAKDLNYVSTKHTECVPARPRIVRSSRRSRREQITNTLRLSYFSSRSVHGFFSTHGTAWAKVEERNMDGMLVKQDCSTERLSCTSKKKPVTKGNIVRSFENIKAKADLQR